jgi:hypothetical protein
LVRYELAPAAWVVVGVLAASGAALAVAVLVGLVALAERVCGKDCLTELGAVLVVVATLG